MWRDSSGERAFTSIRRRRKSRRGFCGKRRSPQQPRKTRNFRTKQRVRASGRITEFCYNDGFGAVPKRPKGEVCKTSIRGFESHPRLQASRFKSMDYSSSVSRNPRFGNIWEQLGKESLPDSRLHADVYPESHACRSSAWSRQKRAPTAAARSWRVRRCRAGPKHECDAVDATSRAQALLPLPPASTRVPEDYSRGAVRPIGSGRVSLPRSIWRRTSCDAHPRVRVSVDRLGWCEYYASPSLRNIARDLRESRIRACLARPRLV